MRIRSIRISDAEVARFIIRSAAIAIFFAFGPCCRVHAENIVEGDLPTDVRPRISDLNIYGPQYIGNDGKIFITTSTPLLVTGAGARYSVNREVSSVNELDDSVDSFTLPLGRQIIRYGSIDRAGNAEGIRISSISVVSMEEFIQRFDPIPEMTEHPSAIKANVIRFTNQLFRASSTTVQVQLNEIQRKQFIAMLDWHSLIESTAHPAPPCKQSDTKSAAIQFKGAGTSITVTPHCEHILLQAQVKTHGLFGVVMARGFIPGSRRGWGILQESLFPREIHR